MFLVVGPHNRKYRMRSWLWTLSRIIEVLIFSMLICPLQCLLKPHSPTTCLYLSLVHQFSRRINWREKNGGWYCHGASGDRAILRSHRAFLCMCRRGGRRPFLTLQSLWIEAFAWSWMVAGRVCQLSSSRVAWTSYASFAPCMPRQSATRHLLRRGMLSECCRRLHCVLFFSVSVTGTLKGYDQLVNLVLDEAVEHERGEIQRSSRLHDYFWVFLWLTGL